MSDVTFPPSSHYRARSMAKIKQMATYSVEGEAVNIDQVAERLGMTNRDAHSVFSWARKKPGAVTWQRLHDIADGRKKRNVR